MPAPSNTSFLTATDLGTLPATVSQQVDDAGTTYTVYFKVTAPSGATVLGAFAFGDLSDYRPLINVYEGPAASPSTVLDITAQNVPVQFPVTPGTEYFLEIVANANVSPSNLTLDVQVAPDEAVDVGDLVVPDDTVGFPAAIIDPATGAVVRFIPFPPGEQGDVLDDGTILVEDNDAGVVKVYDGEFALRATLDPFGAASVSVHLIRLSPDLQVFYVGASITGGAQITTVLGAGVQGGTTWTLSGVGLTAIAPNNDGSIVYVAGQGGSTNTPVKAWNTATNDFDTDLIAGQGADTFVFDMLVLGDGSIIVGWKNSSTGAVTVKRLDAAGSVLGTFDGGTSSGTAPKLAYDPDSRTTQFWLWTHASGVSTFRKIDASAMTVSSTVTTREYEDGAYQGSETATPDQRFGNSLSCPFFFTRASIPATLGTPGPIVWLEWPRRVP